ncbi:MAG: hypothetical protein ACRDTD_29255 [Pseudonocardiaceae bacterium]
MSASARSVLTAAVIFAISMGALEHGGWWWEWLAGIALVAARKGVRVPLLGGVRLSAANRYIMRENRKIRRDTRKNARRLRRLNREKLRNSKRSRATPL